MTISKIMLLISVNAIAIVQQKLQHLRWLIFGHALSISPSLIFLISNLWPADSWEHKTLAEDHKHERRLNHGMLLSLREREPEDQPENGGVTNETSIRPSSARRVQDMQTNPFSIRIF